MTHGFQPTAESNHRCTCGKGCSSHVHRHSPAPPTITVQFIEDMEHLVMGQQLLVNGELYEVVADEVSLGGR